MFAKRLILVIPFALLLMANFTFADDFSDCPPPERLLLFYSCDGKLIKAVDVTSFSSYDAIYWFFNDTSICTVSFLRLTSLNVGDHGFEGMIYDVFVYNNSVNPSQSYHLSNKIDSIVIAYAPHSFCALSYNYTSFNLTFDSSLHHINESYVSNFEAFIPRLPHVSVQLTNGTENSVNYNFYQLWGLLYLNISPANLSVFKDDGKNDLYLTLNASALYKGDLSLFARKSSLSWELKINLPYTDSIFETCTLIFCNEDTPCELNKSYAQQTALTRNDLEVYDDSFITYPLELRGNIDYAHLYRNVSYYIDYDYPSVYVLNITPVNSTSVLDPTYFESYFQLSDTQWCSVNIDNNNFSFNLCNHIVFNNLTYQSHDIKITFYDPANNSINIYFNFSPLYDYPACYANFSCYKKKNYAGEIYKDYALKRNFSVNDFIDVIRVVSFTTKQKGVYLSEELKPRYVLTPSCDVIDLSYGYLINCTSYYDYLIYNTTDNPSQPIIYGNLLRHQDKSFISKFNGLVYSLAIQEIDVNALNPYSYFENVSYNFCDKLEDSYNYIITSCNGTISNITKPLNLTAEVVKKNVLKATPSLEYYFLSNMSILPLGSLVPLYHKFIIKNYDSIPYENIVLEEIPSEGILNESICSLAKEYSFSLNPMEEKNNIVISYSCDLIKLTKKEEIVEDRNNEKHVKYNVKVFITHDNTFDLMNVFSGNYTFEYSLPSSYKHLYVYFGDAFDPSKQLYYKIKDNTLTVFIPYDYVDSHEFEFTIDYWQTYDSSTSTSNSNSELSSYSSSSQRTYVLKQSPQNSKEEKEKSNEKNSTQQKSFSKNDKKENITTNSLSNDSMVYNESKINKEQTSSLFDSLTGNYIFMTISNNYLKFLSIFFILMAGIVFWKKKSTNNTHNDVSGRKDYLRKLKKVIN